RLTKFGTLPAAMRRPSGCPLIDVPSRNCACVHTEAMVVISLTVTLAGGVATTTAKSAIAGLSPLALLAAGWPPLATRYKTASPPPPASSAKRPSAPVRVWASCRGAPALAAHNVTVDPAIGVPAPVIWPLMLFCCAAAGPAARASNGSSAMLTTKDVFRYLIKISSSFLFNDFFRDISVQQKIRNPTVEIRNKLEVK